MSALISTTSGSGSGRGGSVSLVRRMHERAQVAVQALELLEGRGPLVLLAWRACSRREAAGLPAGGSSHDTDGGTQQQWWQGTWRPMWERRRPDGGWE